jgi:outer membrane protein assembly factor BamA
MLLLSMVISAAAKQEPFFTESLSGKGLSEKTTSPKDYQVNDITVVIHPIFSEEERTGWIYKTADELHIDTKPYVIERLLPFKKGERVHKRMLKEAGRILRRQGFLRDAKVSWEPSETGEGIDVTVETWETWTLVPTVDVSREGGVTEYAYGIEDDNLLGHGIRATLEYFKEDDRSGYTFIMASDVSTEHHIQAAIALSNNSDGEQYSVSIKKPFYTLEDKWSAGAYYNSQKLRDTIYSNDEAVNIFEQDIDAYDLSYGISQGLSGQHSLRYLFGYSQDKNYFKPLADTVALPYDRGLEYFWAGLEYQEDDFIQTNNLYLIGRTEDVQLGWYQRLILGYNTSELGKEKGVIGFWKGRYVAKPDDDHLFHFFGNASSEGNSIDNLGNYLGRTSYYGMGFEHFYHSSPEHIWYSKVHYRGADNHYIDRPISLGGESGLRGYPLEYQNGEESFLVNFERRFYPGTTWFKLLNVGYAGFIDAGRVSGNTLYPNQEDGTLVSAGVGLRLFIARSSGRKVINIDLASPLNSDYLSGVDLSITLKASF